jgi:UDP-N-acetylglucosamine 2-epimerase (non-hydrolysing)
MIYIILGTKGQFIKMFPLMKLLDAHRITYRYIHTSQHYGITRENAKLLNVRQPDMYLSKKKKDLRNVWDFLRWAPEVLWNGIKLPIKPKDYVINHGDTESTFLTLCITKFFRAKMVHIESGMRSGTYLEPFPEEIIRSLTDRFSDFRFAPYKKDARQLSGLGKVVITNGNTGFDAVRLALNEKPSSRIRLLNKKPYILFLVHRKETLFSKKNLSKVLQILHLLLEKDFIVIWPLHANTIFELKTKGMWNRVQKWSQDYSLTLEGMYSYVDFMHLLKGSLFAVADGDGVQEEGYLLNKPTLILRNVTDSLPGIGETAFVSHYSIQKTKEFLKKYHSLKRKTKLAGSPSKIILDYLITFAKSRRS